MGKHMRTCLHENLNTVSKRLKKNIDSLKNNVYQILHQKGNMQIIWNFYLRYNNLRNFYLGEPSKYIKTENHFNLNSCVVCKY